jgi:hypothetical protein
MKTFLLLTAIFSAAAAFTTSAAFTTFSTANYETTFDFMKDHFRTNSRSLPKALRLGE